MGKKVRLKGSHDYLDAPKVNHECGDDCGGGVCGVCDMMHFPSDMI